MSRALRIEYCGAWYHFTCRGNARASIFQDDKDRQEFLSILADSLKKYQVTLHCFVLMKNHFHLLLETPHGNLKQFAQRFNTTYTVYFNRRHKRVGHLYQGRYKAILIEKEAYLLELSRYIHLNPVKILKIRKLSISEQINYLRDYRWSSYLGYGFLRRQAEFVFYNAVLLDFGGYCKSGRKGYRGFVEEGILGKIPSPFEDLKGQVVLGDAKFIDWIYEEVMEGKRPDKIEHPKSQELAKEIKFDEIIRVVSDIFQVEGDGLLRKRSASKIPKMVLIELCCRYRIFHKSLKEIGRELGEMTVGGMGAARKKLKETLHYNSNLKKMINKCEENILNDK